jgi:prophage regulatory protein
VTLMSNLDDKPLMNRDEVLDVPDLSRATIDRREKEGRFPQRVRLSPRRVAWKTEEIRAWIASRQRVAEIASEQNGRGTMRVKKSPTDGDPARRKSNQQDGGFVMGNRAKLRADAAINKDDGAYVGRLLS